MNEQQFQPKSSEDWSALVAKIKSNDPNGMDELRQVFASGIRFFLNRQLGLLQLEARIEATFTIMMEAIKSDDLREQHSLVRLVHSIIKKTIAAYSGKECPNRRQFVGGRTVAISDNSRPDMEALHLKNVAHMVTVIRSTFLRDQEAITRFYYLQHTKERICGEMNISEAQFVEMKAHVKAKFREGSSRLELQKHFSDAVGRGSQET